MNNSAYTLTPSSAKAVFLVLCQTVQNNVYLGRKEVNVSTFWRIIIFLSWRTWNDYHSALYTIFFLQCQTAFLHFFQRFSKSSLLIARQKKRKKSSSFKRCMGEQIYLRSAFNDLSNLICWHCMMREHELSWKRGLTHCILGHALLPGGIVEAVCFHVVTWCLPETIRWHELKDTK